MTCFRPDGHLTDAALTALVRGDCLEELDRLELAEHLAYCDQCLQRYTELLSEGPMLTLTLLWGSGNLSGRVHSTAPSLLERAGTALTKWTDAWPQAWEEALSGFSGLFDNFGVSPRNDLTQGGTHP